MSKRVYISADYADGDGDRVVVNELNRWGQDNLHKVDFVDMAKVVSGTVANDDDCRICDLKAEFNRQINASSVVIFVVGDKTANRTAGAACCRSYLGQVYCTCTPYKANRNSSKTCRVVSTNHSLNGDVGNINTYSYLRHEFEQAKKKNKEIIILYNSTRNETAWLPSYMKGYEDKAMPFWMYNSEWKRVGNYAIIKNALGFD